MENLKEKSAIKKAKTIEKDYKKAYNFIVGKYGDKEGYSFIDNLMKELKEYFKMTQKEVKEILLNKLIDDKKIELIKIPFSQHKTVRFYKNGINYSVDRFKIVNVDSRGE